MGSWAFFIVSPSSVVVRDLDIVSPTVSPGEADSVLIVDADRVLARTIARQSLEAVAGRHPKT
jgi:hypothetical protein